MERFKIAIIDSGIEITHPRLAGCIASGIIFQKKNGVITCLHEVGQDEIGHGTAIASIIHRIVPDIELVILKLKTPDGSLSEDLLCEALNWCLHQEDIKIINISMGIADTSPSLSLTNLCRQAFEKEIIISASSHNMPDQTCYPAFFPFVYGVTSGYIKNKLDYGYIQDAPINIIAKGTTQRIAWKGGSYKITSGNSYATAYFSGIVALILLENPEASFEEIRREIAKRAKKDIHEIQYTKRSNTLTILKNPPTEKDGEQMFCIQKSQKHIKRVALFPVCEKEIGTILNFREQCPFEITKYFDYPRKYNFFNLNKRNESYPVTNQIIDKDFEIFDTLVVGYFLDQMFDANILFGYELIEKAISKNKNFIVFDKDIFGYIKRRLALPEHKEYTGQIYMPYVNKEVYEKTLFFDYLPPVNVPVLLVTGTSNKQGKVTTQMRLKKILQDEGYKTSFVTTEPQGLLLGADYIFPFGYKATVSINEDVWGVFMNTVMRGVNYYNSPNLILTGTQGQLIPRDKSNRSLYRKGAVSALHYMLGVLPDAVICAINPEDSIELIKNTTEIIQIFSKAKILFYVMSPWMRENKKNKSDKLVANNRKLSKEEMKEQMDYFQKALDLPVIDIMDYENNPFILECIINAFTK